MPITTQDIQKLREDTGAGIMDAKRALEHSSGDFVKALAYLKQQGKKVAAKKQNRQTNQGTVGAYVHANGKIAALVAVACESDFVAKTETFLELAHDLAMHIAAVDPQYIKPEDVPIDIIEGEKNAFTAQLKTSGKPEKLWDGIVQGRLNKFYSEICLTKQPFIKEDKKTVEQLLQERILKLGENIQIKGFKRIVL
ncbi:MAG: translation elongation factor Ts [Patescibacteria group bacterium]